MAVQGSNKDQTQDSHVDSTAGAASAEQTKQCELQQREWRRVRRRREVAFRPTGQSKNTQEPGNNSGSEPPDDLVGLALSGGGLRSALFNDGFLQALAHKGMLRFVDYLCSVSGGGYIAGHLMTYSKLADQGQDEQKTSESSEQISGSEKDEESAEPNFHEDRARWHLGRNPENGYEEITHLPGVGGYLNRSFSFFAGYVFRQLPVLGLYVSFIGILATLLALFFRSYDNPIFRTVYASFLGVKFGDELLIAFLPTLLFGCLLIAAVWISRGYQFLFRREIKGIGGIRTASMALLLCLTLTSVAVFMGNSLTYTTSSLDGNQLHLNNFATYVGIIAGAAQLLVFFGQDKLFRSEKSEAASWQRLLQSIVSNGVVLLLLFAMLHLMARENLGSYTKWQDSYLIRGEVTDWRFLARTFEDFEKTPLQGKEAYSPEKTIAFLDWSPWVEQNVLGQSRAHKNWSYELPPSRDEVAIPPSPSQERDGQLPVDSWWRARAILWTCLPAWRNNEIASCEIPSFSATSPEVEDLWRAASQFNHNRTRYVDLNNRQLERADFTEHLCQLLLKKRGEEIAQKDSTGATAAGLTLLGLLRSKPASTSEGNTRGSSINLQKLLAKHVDGRLPHTEVKQSKTKLTKVVATKDVAAKDVAAKDVAAKDVAAKDVAAKDGDGQSSASKVERSELAAAPKGIVERVQLNRMLFNQLNDGKLFRDPNHASTFVVQPHDQHARWRWLQVWLWSFLICLILTLNLNRISELFIFYRAAISRYFLTGASGSPQGSTPLSELQPEESGLPYPIYLAAWLKLDTRIGAERSPRAFAMAPESIQLVDGEQTVTIETANYESEKGKPVTLADAVAVSGSAVTPQMTKSFALSLLMDSLGARLGLWFQSPERTHEGEEDELLWLAVLVLFVGLGLAAIALSVPWSLTLAIGGIVATSAYSLFHRCGYPQLAWSVVKQFTVPISSAGQTMEEQDRKISRAWPNIFVADGGFYDFLGVTELLRRQCSLIIVSDAGINSGSTTLESLAAMCEMAKSELGVRFLDLDHDSPIDFGRLFRNEDRYAPQPYLAMRIQYPVHDCGSSPATQDKNSRTGAKSSTKHKEGILFYAQMAITEADPIEIQQIRYRFPSFPDEPTTNQFYTSEQVEAYRNLGYHIGNRLCSHLQRWDVEQIETASEKIGEIEERKQFVRKFKERVSRNQVPSNVLDEEVEPQLAQSDASDIASEKMAQLLEAHEASLESDTATISEEHRMVRTAKKQPLFGELTRRLRSSYVQACFEEDFYRDNDVYGESIWRSEVTGCYPAFDRAKLKLSKLWHQHRADNFPPADCYTQEYELARFWLDRYTENADVFCRYLEAVNSDVNPLSSDFRWFEKPEGHIGGASRCSKIFSEISAEHRQEHEPWHDLDFASLWAAHLTVVAAACQQLHRGVGQGVFQVGGRYKLCSLIAHLVSDLTRKHRAELTHQTIGKALVHEIYELSESVFQGSEKIAVVSFAQCICKEIAQWKLHGSFETSEEHGRRFDLHLDFRQLLLDKLQAGYRSSVQRLISEYLRALAEHANPAYYHDEDVLITRSISTPEPVQDPNGGS